MCPRGTIDKNGKCLTIPEIILPRTIKKKADPSRAEPDIVAAKNPLVTRTSEKSAS